jgi:hypothetical protein
MKRLVQETTKDMDIRIMWYMTSSHKGKERVISYSRLRTIIHFGFNQEYYFKSKDTLRAYLNDLFDRYSHFNYNLISTAKGVFVASNKEEIAECAERIRRHAMGELRKYAKLMKLPQDQQLLINFETEKIEMIGRKQ